MFNAINNLKSQQHGFTLIELMITVSIVAILSAIALPVYNTYTTRARIAEGFELSKTAKINVLDIAAAGIHHGEGYATGFAGLDSADPTDDTTNVNGLEIDGSTGEITITFTAAAGGGIPGSDTVTLAPATLEVLTLGGGLENFSPPSDVVQWTCTTTIAAALKPCP